MSEVRTGDGALWYVVYTKPREEYRVEVNLMAWGVSTFLPRLKERRYRRYTTRQVDLTKPLFPRYLFAHFNASEQLHQITFTRGVCSIISFDGKPSPVDDEVIETIRSQSDQDGFVNIDENLNSGDKVVIKIEPFENLRGTFQGETRQSEQVLILLSSVSYQGRLLINRAFVKKVAESN